MHAQSDEKLPRRDPLIADFLDFLRVERRLAANSVEAYGRDLERYCGFLSARGPVGLLEVEVALLREFLAWLAGQGLAASSRARSLAAVRSFYRFLLLEGRIGQDPTEYLEAPRGWKKLPRYLSGARGWDCATPCSWRCSTTAVCGFPNWPRCGSDNWTSSPG
jgi:site-specific recombinase XerD